MLHKKKQGVLSSCTSQDQNYPGHPYAYNVQSMSFASIYAPSPVRAVKFYESNMLLLSFLHLGHVKWHLKRIVLISRRETWQTVLAQWH